MAEFLDTYLGTVEAWECDFNGHMNIQFYMERFGHGSHHLRAAIGLAPSVIRTSGITIVALGSRIRYRRELLSGDTVAIRTYVREVGEKTIRVTDELVSLADGETSAIADHVGVCFDLERRKSLVWPAEVRQRAETLVTGMGPEGVAPLSEPDLGGESAPGEPFLTHRDAVFAWECDHIGHLNARFYIARISDAAAVVLNHMGLPRTELERRRWGSAGLEHHIAFKQELRAGDLITVTTGLREVRNKTFRVLHNLANAESGETAATVEVVGCLLDLERRKALVIPDDIRARMRSLLVDWDGSAD
jgi:acyl-CoA thioester hydrolase